MKKQRLQQCILTADLAWTGVAMLAAYSLRFGFPWHPSRGASFLTFVPLLLTATMVWVGLFSWMKLDGFQLGWYPAAIISQLFVAAGFIVLVLLAVGFLTHDYVSRSALAYFGGLLFIGVVAIRRLVNAVLRSRYLKRALRRVLIVGDGPVAREMATKIDRHPEMLYEVAGFLCSPDVVRNGSSPLTSGKPVPLQTLEVIDLLHEQQIDEVIIASSNPGLPELMNLAGRCRREGLGVSIVPHPYELYLSKPQLVDVGGLPVLQLHDRDVTLANGLLKRSLDVLITIVLLPLALPFILLGTLLLLGKEGGPFSRDLRCGRFGREFYMLRLNSDRGGSDLTAVDHLLQQLSITELPQLWNVLRGEMTLVGPRPESPERVKHYSDWQRQRLNVRPGMTGLAQVHGLREQSSSEEKSRYDMQYLLHRSTFIDISLLFQTIWTLIMRLLRIYNFASRRPDNETEILMDSLLQGRFPSAHSTQSSTN